MAVSKTILKLTHQEAVISIKGSAGTEVIDLDGLVAVGQVLGDDPRLVNIVGVSWSGHSTAHATITRGGTEAHMTLPGVAPDFLDFSGQDMPPQIDNNGADITVVMDASEEMQVWLKLRKVQGYVTTVEPEQFGHYDDPTVAGS